MKKNFNYRIANYFISNQRLTVLTFGLLILVGMIATALLKTSGFPSPELKFAFVQTVYPGASAETVAEAVTQPLEGAIKTVPGVRTYSSTSNNSFSLIRVDIDESADADTVRNKLATALTGITLPAGAETPEVTTPNIGGPDFVVSIAGENLEQVYQTYHAIDQQLGELPDTASVEPTVDLRRYVVVKVDMDKLLPTGLQLTTVQQLITSLGETLPVAGDVTIDEQNQTIQTTLAAGSLEEIRAMRLPTKPGQPIVTIDEISDVSLDYRFADDATPLIGLNADGTALTRPAVTLNIKTTKGSDLTAYAVEMDQIFEAQAAHLILPEHEAEALDYPNDTWIVRHFTSQEFNDRQVSEVISGLIGGKLDISGPGAYIGWVLGGIQLVFLVMLAFVSWRAALVAAAAIPLSLVFSTIYLFFTGNDLNTLVLFSLVLVIGLVVDPALVVLESIQRKIDLGLKGKAATLAAIEDVGNGLFLATLTNIIVFFPFAVVSGLLGEIFSYIPLTIIPATIGSYVVPLIFLAWIGGLFLRPGKRNSNEEEANLWSVARWLIRTNERILRSAVWVRGLIVIVALAVPLVVTGWYFTTDQMKVVQFASGRNADYVDLEASYFSTTPAAERTALLNEIMLTTVGNSAVRQIFPLGNSGQYYIGLQSNHVRGDYLAVDISKDLSAALEPLRARLFDLTTSVDFVGPPRASFQISLAVNSGDAAIRRSAAEAVGKTMLLLCSTDGTITIAETCAGERMITKINDGYTDQLNSVIEVTLDRNKLAEYQLILPNLPVSLLANQVIRQLYPDYQRSSTTVTVDGDTAYLMVQTDQTAPATPAEIEELVIAQSGPITLRLKDIATIHTVEGSASITRTKGQTQAVVLGRLQDQFNDQTIASQVTSALVDYYQANDGEKMVALHLTADDIGAYSEGSTASDNKSFQQLFIALGLAIVFTYIVLAVFFGSFTQPLVVLFTVPLSFLGIFPALTYLGNGQFGFLEIIGLIILVGIVENVAIFLLDAARQKQAEGWDDIRAISYAAGVRLRPVLLTKFTAIASLAPLAALSETYRSISLVIMFGLLTSGFTSLITTPILYIFFRWLSRHFHSLAIWQQALFFLFSPIYLIKWAWQDHRTPKQA